SSDAPTTDISTLSLHDALPIYQVLFELTRAVVGQWPRRRVPAPPSQQQHQTGRQRRGPGKTDHRYCEAAIAIATGCRRCGRLVRSEEHTSELQSRENLVCRLLL